jgi:hypothetical protein
VVETVNPLLNDDNTEGESAEKTIVLQGTDDMLKFILPRFVHIKKTIDSCYDHTGPAAIAETEPVMQESLKFEKRGIKFRFLTEIRKENIAYCKKLLDLKVVEMRHLDGVKGNFGIVDSRECFEHTLSKEGELPTQGVFTSVKALVDARQFLFDSLWKRGIPAEERMKEIEEGIQPIFTETIRDPLEIQKVAFDLIKNAKEEIQMILPSTNIILNQEEGHYDTELLKLLADKAENKNNDIKIRILLFSDTNSNNRRKYIEERTIRNNKIEMQYLETSLMQKTFSTLIIDRKYLLVLEPKDDITNIHRDKSIGLATYSNSEATVSSYSSVFETFWIKSQLQQQQQ